MLISGALAAVRGLLLFKSVSVDALKAEACQDVRWQELHQVLIDAERLVAEYGTGSEMPSWLAELTYGQNQPLWLWYKQNYHDCFEGFLSLILYLSLHDESRRLALLDLADHTARALNPLALKSGLASWPLFGLADSVQAIWQDGVRAAPLTTEPWRLAACAERPSAMVLPASPAFGLGTEEEKILAAEQIVRGLDPGALVIDAGVFDGTDWTLAGILAGATVLGFEPVKKNLELFEERFPEALASVDQPQCIGCGPRVMECWKACSERAGLCSACNSVSGTLGLCCRIDDGVYYDRDPAECKSVGIQNFRRQYSRYHQCVVPGSKAGQSCSTHVWTSNGVGAVKANQAHAMFGSPEAGDVFTEAHQSVFAHSSIGADTVQHILDLGWVECLQSSSHSPACQLHTMLPIVPGEAVPRVAWADVFHAAAVGASTGRDGCMHTEGGHAFIFGAALGEQVHALNMTAKYDYSSVYDQAYLEGPQDQHQEKVAMTTLDRVFAELLAPAVNGTAQVLGTIDVLKIDVEGYEMGALRGSERLLSEGRVHYIVMEFHPGMLGTTGTDPQGLLEFLQHYCFSCYSFKIDRPLGFTDFVARYTTNVEALPMRGLGKLEDLVCVNSWWHRELPPLPVQPPFDTSWNSQETSVDWKTVPLQ